MGSFCVVMIFGMGLVCSQPSAQGDYCEIMKQKLEVAPVEFVNTPLPVKRWFDDQLRTYKGLCNKDE